MKIVYMHHAERDKNEDDNITERGIRHISLLSFGKSWKASKEIELNWEDGYGKLTKGEYRIIKDVDYEYEEGRYESFYIAVEFTIE